MNYQMNAVTVSEINNFIKQIIDNNEILSDILVSGELSNVKVHFSGHIYMTLKDEKSSIRMVMFKSDAQSLRFRPENGMKVLVRGRISVYERDGQYQLYAKMMQPDGVGALFMAFEQLKAKLDREGLFAPEHKKPIPPFPQTVGVVTAKTGAAVRDILNILKRRYPLAEPRVFPVLVQGEQASRQIARAISYINEKKLADVIIVGRGGGSIEDLWAFNEEVVARAVFASEIPVISAVGHETDFTICDFVADLRAPTPSAAAELAVPEKNELLSQIVSYKNAMRANLLHNVEKQKMKHERLSAFFKPEKLTEMIENRRMELDSLVSAMKDATDEKIKSKKTELENIIVRLSAQNPLNLLAKGFSVAKNADGKIIKSVKNVACGDKINVSLSDGTVKAIVESLE